MDYRSGVQTHFFSYEPWWVLFEEQLLWNLSELADADLSNPDIIFSLTLQENVPLIALVMVEIIVLLSHTHG